jgi:hypothetical protein
MEMNGTLGIPTKSKLLVCCELNNYHAYKSLIIVYIGANIHVREHFDRAQTGVLPLSRW